MKTLVIVAALAAVVSSAFAAAPADAPAGSKGLCKDGTYSTSAEKKGACRGHSGVKDWYGEEATAAPMNKVGAAMTTSGAAPAASSMPAPKAAPAIASTSPSTSTPTSIPTQSKPTRSAMPSQAAPGGGAGLVWGNEGTKVYHCNGDQFYGKTKKGEYMTEADAKAKGFRPSGGKACV